MAIVVTYNSGSKGSGSIDTADNLLSVSGTTVEFGGTAIQNTTGQLDGFDLLFQADLSNTINAGIIGFNGGRVWRAGWTEPGGTDFIYSWAPVRYGPDAYFAGSAFLFDGYGPQLRGYSGVQMNRPSKDLFIENEIQNLNTLSKSGVETSFDQIGTVVRMGAISQVNAFLEHFRINEPGGLDVFDYNALTGQMIVGENTYLFLEGASIGFFGNSVVQQQPDSLTGIAFDPLSLPNTVTALNTLLSRLQTWELALGDTKTNLFKFI